MSRESCRASMRAGHLTMSFFLFAVFITQLPDSWLSPSHSITMQLIPHVLALECTSRRLRQLRADPIRRDYLFFKSLGATISWTIFAFSEFLSQTLYTSRAAARGSNTSGSPTLTHAVRV